MFKELVDAQGVSLERDLLKSPMISTPRPARRSAVAHVSAVVMTYSSGLRGP